MFSCGGATSIQARARKTLKGKLMQYIDDAEFQIAIDLDNGARITSITWRDMQFAVPYRGDL